MFKTGELMAALPAMDTEGAAPVKRGRMPKMSTWTSVLPQYIGEPLSRTVTLSTIVRAGE